MSREIKIKMVKEDFPENIEVAELFSDRIIVRPYFIAPLKTSNIINPGTQKAFDSPDFDRYPFRAEVVKVGDKIRYDGNEIYEGDTVFIEDRNALVHMPLNGEDLFRTRLTNIILVYKNKNISKSKKK